MWAPCTLRAVPGQQLVRKLLSCTTNRKCYAVHTYNPHLRRSNNTLILLECQSTDEGLQTIDNSTATQAALTKPRCMGRPGPTNIGQGPMQCTVQAVRTGS